MDSSNYIPDYSTMYQAEAVTLREAQIRVESREGRKLVPPAPRPPRPRPRLPHQTASVGEDRDGGHMNGTH